MGFSRTVTFLLVVSCLGVRVLLALTGVGDALSQRVEVATPLTSIQRISEGALLLELGMSPYHGSLCHAPPLLVVLLSPFVKASAAASMRWRAVLLRLVPFLLADACTVLLLHRIATIFRSSRRGRRRGLADAVTQGPEKGGPAHASWVALLFLANPLSIAACAGGSTATIDNAAVLLALFGGIAGNTSLAACGLALAGYLSLHPLLLALPVLMLLIHGADAGPLATAVSGPATTTKATDLSGPATTTKATDLSGPATTGAAEELEWGDHASCHRLDGASCRKDGLGDDACARQHAARCQGVYTQAGATASSPPWLPTALKLAAFTLIWSSALLLLSAMILKGRGGLRPMLHSTYGLMLMVEDLRPNLGLHWYFFTEMFDHFRSFFTFVFAAMAPCYLLPLVFRLWRRPLFLCCCYLMLVAIVKPYPTVADAALYLSLLPIFHQQLSRGLRFSFVTINGYLYALVLGPLLYNLWIFQGSGNANFFYATTLVYALAQSLLLMDAVRCTLEHDKQSEVAALDVSSSEVTKPS